MAITKEQVFAVADKMFADGTAPTLIGIRKELGSGSFSTISGMLAEWKSSTRKGDGVVEVELPEELQDGLQSVGARIWAFALKLAQDDAQLTKDESRELVKLAESARDEALQLATDLQVENDKIIDQVVKLQAKIEEGEFTKIELNKELAKARSVVEEQRDSYRQLLARVPHTPISHKAVVAASGKTAAKVAPVKKVTK